MHAPLSLLRRGLMRSFAQRLRSCSQIRHVKCSEMYLIVILNPKKTNASAEERARAWLAKLSTHQIAVETYISDIFYTD